MIRAKIIQDSISNAGKRITTFELEYPRFIHSEFMTHRQFSRNAASSRAIPVEKMHEYIHEHPATPIYWGKNQPGMQAKTELTGSDKTVAKYVWATAKNQAILHAKELLDIGVHKQIANRITEPFQTMKTVCTATEFTNWFWLRNHEDAQPEIKELAVLMQEALDCNEPFVLFPGEWHVPYINRARLPLSGKVAYTDNNGNQLTEDDAKVISASCCAQVSYRKSDDTIQKAKVIFDRLINSEPVHASPIEHQATPMAQTSASSGLMWWNTPGYTHCKANGNLCSGNFEGWVQYRQLFSNQFK